MSVHNVIRFIRANKKCWILPVVLTNSAASTVCNKQSQLTTDFPESAVDRRFFVFVTSLILVFSFQYVDAAINSLCLGNKLDPHVRLSHVIDGDTVVLAGGERLRLIGIDTPEIGYDGKLSQPGAIEARNFLKDLLNSRELYLLKRGIEQRDRYGRSLGHLFLTDGTNLQALILAQGYATPLNVPPNLEFSDCYQQQTNKAIEAGLGLWKLKQYQPGPVNRLTGAERGYRILYGRVSSIGNSNSSVWLNMNRFLTIKIQRSDLLYFPALEFDQLAGRDIQVRGMLYRSNKQLRMRLRHHSDLHIAGEAMKSE